MTTRITETRITFTHPFSLSCFKQAQPAGTYLLVVEEEELLGLSFSAYRKTATTLHVPALSVISGSRAAYAVDATELEAALAADTRSHPDPV
ncbi:hypothetical protein [Ferrovibrio sp.]|uniref:hypothetical protein n=1 Tax=Ferrovibrio sp. TaxID=1917215 RepID=UPI001B788CC0|nr:hypothetical protein [Ferrovibrio sp.]MBP7063146.1 hypothetical protein [Ferrovibrio sp.]